MKTAPYIGRYLHVSCEAGMIQDPKTLRTTPWVQRPGTTYNVGRNKAKRLKRARVWTK